MFQSNSRFVVVVLLLNVIAINAFTQYRLHFLLNKQWTFNDLHDEHSPIVFRQSRTRISAELRGGHRGGRRKLVADTDLIANGADTTTRKKRM